MTVQSSRDVLKIVDAADYASPISFSQYVESPTHLRVYADTALLSVGVHYTVSATPADGVTVTITAAGLSLGADVVAILHAPPMDQNADLSVGGTFGTIYENALDAIMRRLQYLNSQTARAYKAPIDSGRTDPTITPGADYEHAIFFGGNIIATPDAGGGGSGGGSTGATLRIEDKVTASGLIDDDVFWIETNAYDATVHPTKGAARYRVSSLSEIGGVNPRFWFSMLAPAGIRYFIIDTVNQKITLTMAGGRGDLVYALESGLNSGGGDGNGVTSTEGFIRSAGTNDRTAMLALDAFATANGIFAYIDADHYTSPQTKLTAQWWDITENYTHTLWAEYFSPYDGTLDTITDEIEVGYWFENPGPVSGFKKLKMVGQFNSAGASKPAVCVPDMPILGQGGGLGHKGAIILIGEQYYAAQPAAPITHCDLDIMIMRAGRYTTTGHYSQGNLMIACSGYVEHCDWRIGLFGKTNTTNNWVILILWGSWYDPSLNGFAAYDDFIPNKTQSTLVEQYFPSYNELRFLTDIDNTVTFANIGKTYELNGCGPTTVHSYYAKGVPVGAGAVTCGDYTDVLACPKQRGLPNRGIKIGFIKADLCYQNNAVNEFRKGGFLVKGGGTSSGRTFLYDGTADLDVPDVTTLVPVLPQLQWTGNRGIQKFFVQTFDMECVGFDLEVINSENNPVDGDGVSGMQILHGLGRLNLGAVNLRGDARRGIEIEHFNGDVIIEAQTGVGVLSHEFSKGGRFRNINNDRGTAVEIKFTSGGVHTAAVGETITGLTSAATGTVRKVRVTSGSFAAGTAAGYIEVDIVSGTFAAENATLTGGTNDMTVVAVSVGGYKPGYGTVANPTENYAIQIVGTTFTAGVTSADVAAGATKIPLVADVPTQIYVGDKIKVGTVWTVATECIVEPQYLDVASGAGVTTNVFFGGVRYVTVEPLVAAVLAGATVTVDQRSYVHELTTGYRNSQYGLRVQNSDVKNCDIGAVKSAGQYAARLESGAHVEFVGSLPATVGRSGLTDSTVRLDDVNTLAVFHGCNIPANPNVSTHVQLPTGGGRAVFDGCRVETPTALHPTTEGNSSWDKIKIVNSYDFAGNGLRNGPYTVTPVVRTGGVAVSGTLVNASRISIDAAGGVDLTIEVTLGTVAAPTAGSLTVVNDAGGSDWPAPNAAQTGIVDVIANGVGLPASVSCEIATDKTITLYTQGATGRVALTDANIATGMQFRARLRYMRAAA